MRSAKILHLRFLFELAFHCVFFILTADTNMSEKDNDVYQQIILVLKIIKLPQVCLYLQPLAYLTFE